MRRTVVVAATLTALTLTAPAFAADAPPTDPGLEQRQKGYDAAGVLPEPERMRDLTVQATTQGVLSLLR